MINYQMKQIPSDFKVSEVPILNMSTSEESSIHYYFLEKVGFSTFEAKEVISKHFGIFIDEIYFAGLKDEDGHTLQYFSLEQYLDAAQLQNFNETFRKQNIFIKLGYHSKGLEHVKVAQLHGNTFYITIRGLDNVPDCLGALADSQFYFINYYDTQRFGRPGRPKNTHKIGAALVVQDFATAWEELNIQYALEPEKILKYQHSPALYFKMLDQGRVAFYQSAYYSHLWNQKVKEHLRGGTPDYLILSREGIEYLVNCPTTSVLSLFHNCTELPNTRVVLSGNTFVSQNYPRPTVIQTHINIIKIEPDLLNPGKYACQLSFFLPSGSYATMVIAQFLLQLAAKKIAAGFPA